jgi:hypothetical protein
MQLLMQGLAAIFTANSADFDKLPVCTTGMGGMQLTL